MAGETIFAPRLLGADRPILPLISQRDCICVCVCEQNTSFFIRPIQNLIRTPFEMEKRSQYNSNITRIHIYTVLKVSP